MSHDQLEDYELDMIEQIEADLPGGWGVTEFSSDDDTISLDHRSFSEPLTDEIAGKVLDMAEVCYPSMSYELRWQGTYTSECLKDLAPEDDIEPTDAYLVLELGWPFESCAKSMLIDIRGIIWDVCVGNEPKQGV